MRHFSCQIICEREIGYGEKNFFDKFHCFLNETSEVRKNIFYLGTYNSAGMERISRCEEFIMRVGTYAVMLRVNVTLLV